MEFLDYLKENNIDYKEEDGKIVVKGNLFLWNSKITKLPEGLSVDKGLYLNYTQITELPESLSVGGNMILSSAPITKLPNKLSVGGDLCLRGTEITKLPDNLSVGGWLDLDVEKITNIFYYKDCNWFGCPIFATYVNGKIQIGANFFLGSLKAFEAMVNEGIAKEYITAADAEEYKQSARECIKELEEMRKDETKQKKDTRIKNFTSTF